MARTQGVKQNEIIEPTGVLGSEGIELAAGFAGRGADEASSRFEQKGHLLREDLIVLNWAVCIRELVDFRAIDPTVIGEAFEADQKWVAGEG